MNELLRDGGVKGIAERRRAATKGETLGIFERRKGELLPRPFETHSLSVLPPRVCHLLLAICNVNAIRE